MHSIPFFVNAIAIAWIAIFADCQIGDSRKTTAYSEDHLQYGPISVDTYFNGTTSNDKLGLIHGQGQSSMRLLNQTTIWTLLADYREELLGCDDLILNQHLDRKSLMDCKLLESHFLPNSSSLSISNRYSYEKEYVQRLSIKLKSKFAHKVEISGKQEHNFYPLRDDVIQTNINSLVAANNFGELNFMQNDPIKFGFYYEGRLKFTQLPHPLTCSGNLFFIVNLEDILTKEKISSSRKDEAEKEDYIDMALKNGYLLNVQGLTCRSAAFEPFAISFDFAIVHKQHFPYLNVRFSMATKPLDQILYFQVSVDQTSDNTKHQKPISYNTTIKMESSSAIVPLVNFKMNHIFVHQDSQNGFEELLLKHSQFLLASNSTWSQNSFAKSILLNLEGLFGDVNHALKEAIQLYYEDQNSDDLITMTMKIKKNLLRPLNFNFSPNQNNKKSRDEL